MELRILMRSSLLADDPVFLEEIRSFREKYNIPLKHLPEFGNEATHVAERLIELIPTDVLGSESICCQQLKRSYVEGDAKLYTVLFNSMPAFCRDLYYLIKRLFPDYPLSVVVSYQDHIQRFVLMHIFFGFYELPSSPDAFRICELTDVHAVNNLMKLSYALKLLAKKDINLDEYMQKNDPDIYIFLKDVEKHYSKQHPRLFLELHQSLLKRDLMAAWGEIKKNIDKVHYSENPLPLKKWEEYVEYLKEYNFEQKSLPELCDFYGIDNDTMYKSVKKTAKATNYTLRDRKQRGKKDREL